jgi:transcriptional regulator with XRE-family HTH domain
MSSFPKFTIRRSALLPWSRLYCIEPIGIGTPLVESLTGYISRLAEAHQLSVSLLFGHELAPHTDKEYLRRAASRLRYPCRIFASAFRPLARAMNGLGTGASEWISILQKLTLRDDLKYLTMMPFKDILPHAQLLRTIRAWCSACYRDWSVEGRIIHEPLLWALKAVTMCPRHHQPLSTTCQHCRKQLHPLASRSRPGYCSTCQRWLGDYESLELLEVQDPNADKATMRLWESHAISEFLASIPTLVSKPLQGGSIKSLNALSRWCKGGLSGLARLLRINKTTIWQWKNGKYLPRFDFLLKICHSLNLSLSNFISGEINDRYLKQEGESSPTADKEKYYVGHKRRSLNTAEARRMLHASLKEVPPPSLEIIAKRLGRASNTLRYQLPDLCRAIVERYKHQKAASPRNVGKRVVQTLQDLLKHKEPAPPRLTDIANQLSCDVTTLRKHATDLCFEVTRRRTEYRMERWKKIEEGLINALTEYPPPSVLKLAERFGCSKTSLYSRFSSICHELAKRRAHYRTSTVT